MRPSSPGGARLHSRAVDGPRRRSTLTPLSSELRPEEPPRAAKPPGLLTRWRRRRERRPPTTLLGAIAMALVRLGVVVLVAAGLAGLIDHFMQRAPSLGFYIVGAFVLAAAVLMSAGDVGTPYYYSQRERERRVNLSFSYILAGIAIIGIAVAIDAFSL